MKNYQVLIGCALVAIAIVIAAVIVAFAINDSANLLRSGLSYLADNIR
jgi:hypothetical protein